MSSNIWVDPLETVEKLWNALKPGGFLYERISADTDEDRPQHIVDDFEPTFERMRALGFVRVWRDEWLWDHQVFRKPCGKRSNDPMSERELVDQKIRSFMDGLWERGDPWDLEHSAYERDRCLQLVKMIEGRRYPRVLEIGCGAGYLTRMLSAHADHIVALDISQTAIDRARSLSASQAQVEFRTGNVMEYKPQVDGPWDLVVFTETICYLGWLYPMFDVAWLAVQLFEATRSGGRLMLANSMDESEDWLLRPWIIRTYRDLFVNVGYTIESEKVHTATKRGVEFEVLMTLYSKPEERKQGQ